MPIWDRVSSWLKHAFMVVTWDGRMEPRDLVDGPAYKLAKSALSNRAVVFDSCTGCEACLFVQPRYDPRTGKYVMADDPRADVLPMIGCLVTLPRVGEGAVALRKIAVDFDACIGCGYCERICNGTGIGSEKFPAVIWNAIEVVKGSALEALAAQGEHDTDPFWFQGALTVRYNTKLVSGKPVRGGELGEILYAHPGLAPDRAPKREVFRRELGKAVRYTLREDGAVDASSKSVLVLHEPVLELFAGEDFEVVESRYGQRYSFSEEYVTGLADGRTDVPAR